MVLEQGGLCEDGGAYLAQEDLILRKYRHWRGRSGRSYVFSVYAPAECPPYEDAVLMVTARRSGRVLACLDLGPFPESRLMRLRRRFVEALGEVEFQIHVLAERAGDRVALIDDLTPLAA
ncbi:MAG: hypothetical protein KGM15_14915 [Pseudomonadota bacterium]|nr:hypothetical protein [Pseudomonadota bacterium]